MQTLNDKIRLIIEENVDAPFSVNGISGVNEAAKEIEKFILQEKIDLLDELINPKYWEDINLTIPIKIYNFRMELIKLNTTHTSTQS